MDTDRWISSDGHAESWIDEAGTTRRGKVPRDERVRITPKKVCLLCAEHAPAEIKARRDEQEKEELAAQVPNLRPCLELHFPDF